jgi:hypothetical protein
MAKQRIRALLLEANGVPDRRRTLIDTSLHPLRGLLGGMRADMLDGEDFWNRLARKVLFPYDELGYMLDWREAFLSHPALEVHTCNISDLFALSAALRRTTSYDVIIIMHSAAGDDMASVLRIAGSLRRRSGKLVMFIGNEYDQMAEKFSLIEEAEVDLVCSMLPIESARWLYGGRAKVKVHSMPQALNPTVYYPGAGARDISLGFVGSFYYPFIGDEDRNRMLRTFMQWSVQTQANADIRIGNIPRMKWAAYLRRCAAVLGAESGTYYLDREGQILARAKAFWRQHPGVAFEQMKAEFFSEVLPPYVTGKHITSRHFEAMGSMACQVLLEGQYNGIIEPGRHYIEMKRDYSNFADVTTQIADASHCQSIASQAYELVMSSHTYRHRIDDLVRVL